MTQFYCDVSAVGPANEYQAYAANMTIGANATDRPRPMDGNGKAMDATAAAVAVAELQVTTNPTAGNTIVIAGATAITAVSAYTAKNQFLIGGTIAATVTNLITCLNTYGTGATVPNCDVTVLAAVSQATLAIPYMYWARLKPGTTNTIQLFTRIAGADLNTANNSTSKVAQTGTWLNSGAASINFTEGVDGPFGYFLSVPALVFGKATVLWGIAAVKSGASVDPSTGDVIIVRTRRSGTDLKLQHSTATNTIYLLNGTTNDRNYVFDNGNTWSGDTGQFSLEVTATNSTSDNNLSWQGNVSLCAEAPYGFRFYYTNTGNNWLRLVNASASGAYYFYAENILIEDSLLAGNATGIDVLRNWYAQPQASFHMKGCKFINKSGTKALVRAPSSNAGGHAQFETCLFEYGGTASGIVDTTYFGSTFSDNTVEFVNCRFYDRNAIVNPCMSSPIVGTGMNSTGRIIFDSCEGLAPFVSPYSASISKQNMQIIYRMPGADGDWRTETGGWISEWRSGANIPFLNGVLPSGTPWAIKSLIRNLSNDRITITPITLNPQYRSVDSIKTITVEILVPTGAAFKKSRLGLSVAYTKPDGTTGREDTFELLTTSLRGIDSDIDTSYAAWDFNGTTGFEKRKLSITTQFPIKAGTRVNVRVQHRGIPVGGIDRTIFIDPEPVFS